MDINAVQAKPSDIQFANVELYPVRIDSMNHNEMHESLKGADDAHRMYKLNSF
jgi:hypothetical protein